MADEISKYFADQLRTQNERAAEKRAKAQAELDRVTQQNDEILKRGHTPPCYPSKEV